MATLALAIGIVGCGERLPDGGASRSPAFLRLVEARGGVSVEWPDDADLGVPTRFETPEIGGLRSPDPLPTVLAEVALPLGSGLEDSRIALLAPPGSAYRFRLELPERPALRLALARLPGTEGSGPTFVVTVTDGLTSARVFESLASDGPGWSETVVALDGWANRKVVVSLETPAAGEGTSAWGAWATPEIVDRRAEPPQPIDVILVSLDTLRADHLGSYGYHRPTSPHLDALAADGVRFATAVAHSPWTRPSHRALFTGLYPSTSAGLRSRPLAQELWLAGWRTGAITGGGQVHARLGFHRGFETYRVDQWLRSPELVVDWLEGGRQRNDFLFLHTFEIHDPYTDTRFTAGLDPGRIGDDFSARDGWKRRKRVTDAEKAYAEALYDGGIAFTDERLGVLFEALEAKGLLQNTLLVVTSDHGEAFWEHGTWRHGGSMYEHQLRVPLILRLPEGLRRQLGVEAGTVFERQVQLVDLYPTLLDLVGVELDHAVQGISLRPLLQGRDQPERWALAENTGTKALERKAFRTDRHKLIYSYPKRRNRSDAEASHQLYDLVRDPLERVDISAEHPEIIEHYMTLLAELQAGRVEPLDEEVPAGLDPALQEQLRALGYLD